MFSDWLRWPWGCCRKCEERLTGGDGDAEWKEAELPREPGMFTGAELCSKLPPTVMLPGWGTELLSKVFSKAATPNSFRSRSSRADSMTDSTVSLAG